MYDIMNMYKTEEGQTKITNETFNIAPDTVAIRCLYNPKLRLKRMSNINEQQEVKNLIMACQYNRDHRDNIHFQKIPKGYKIIGIRGYKATNNEQCLHVNDFQMWKPPPDWLSVRRLAQRFDSEMNAAKHKDGVDAYEKKHTKFGKKAFTTFSSAQSRTRTTADTTSRRSEIKKRMEIRSNEHLRRMSKF